MTIHKVSISIRTQNPISVKLPKNSKVLSCDFQGDELVAWFTTSNFDMVDALFYVVRTGEDFPSSVLDSHTFVGTAYNRDLQFPFVIHLFYNLQTHPL